MIEKLAENPNGEALSWLLEMELVNQPYVLNSIILNLVSGLKGIKNVELVIDEKQKKILIYLELTWFSNHFKWKEIEAKTKRLIEQALPSFKHRVIFDREILEKALKVVKDRESNEQRI